MPKCPNCPQFTSKDTDVEPEVEVEADSEGMVTGNVRLVNQCEDCGEELEETSFTVEIDLTKEVAEHRKKCKGDRKPIRPGKASDKPTRELTVEEECSRSDETQTVDRRGKRITNPRYRRRYYGFDLTVTLNCDDCGEKGIASGTFSDKTTAGGMESLV